MAVAASGPFAENVLLCDIKIGEGVAAAKILKNILEKCCALYNAGGGVLEMRIVDFEDLEPPHNELNRFWSTVEQKLKALIEPLSYVDVFERTFDRNSGKVYLFIKNVPNHFCTLRFNLFLAGDSGIYEASNIEAINVMTKPLNLKKKRHSDVDAPLSSLPKVDKEFAYGESVSFHESRRIEFKHYKSEQILSENNRTQCDNLRKIISSFANTNGGVIYLGITDEGIAYGHNLERDSTEAIEERVHFLIDKMYWSVTPKREVHWDLKFFPLVGKENHSVIVIYVAGMQTSGGVFAKCPVSVELRPSEDGSEGQVHLLDFDEWKQRMVGRTDVQTVQTDSKGGLTTPQEILARGPLAVKIYNKALKEGKTNARRLPIMLIGQHRMGKTSLKKSLKGDLFDAEEESTIGIEVDPSYFKMTTEIWRPGELDKTTCSDSGISFEHQAARLIVSDMKDIRETYQATTGEPTQASNNSQPHHEPSTSRDTRVTTCEVSNTNELDQEQEQPLIEPGMPDDIANLVTKSIFEDVKVDEEEQIYSILWDFGGQSVYYVTHPLYLTTRAIYLLVYDISRSPNDQAIPVLKQGLFKKLEDSFSVKTNLDYLESWMSSVASLVSDGDGDDVPASHETEKLPSKCPPVFLVCTHADQPYCGRDSATLAAEIFGSLHGKPYSSHLCDSVFAVDNRKSGSEHDCPEVIRLRKEILAVAKELPLMKEEIPLKWLKFEKELQVKIKEGCKWISLENAKLVAFEMCHISEEDEFTTLMKFLHDQRILIHFDDTPSLNKMVVLDIQWLIDVFKKVITVERYVGNGKQYKDLWLKLEKTGILEEKLLEHVWGPLYEHKETFESLIEIMEKFSLLCIWPSSDESKQYLVPSMLMSHPSEDIIQLVASSQIPSLYLTFNSSQVPIGLFPRMVLQFYQWCSKEWPSPCKPQLYHSFARFHICPDEGCSVILLCHSSFIEIVVHGSNEVRDLSVRLQAEMKLLPNLASDPTPDVRIAHAVRRQVGLMLECMRKEFVWLKNMECKMKVLCPLCCPGGSVHYCRDHATKGCKQEECLHFWSETNLQSGQQFVICDRSAVTRDPRLSIKQFASWFAFLDEQQQAIDECAAREMHSIEEKETKTRLLTTGVLESLQSTSDASNVVARLQDNLQLTQAALADPGPETTRLIRCLATIAKNENRLDVVQRLRQISPAGTTGPLLSEHLDVREIPPSQIRELTITLSGGGEWKLVAERLGLNPAEIRYLDNRTMNPCLEALVHSGNQRFINVDTLYNVLVECGLPMLADVL